MAPVVKNSRDGKIEESQMGFRVFGEADFGYLTLEWWYW